MTCCQPHALFSFAYFLLKVWEKLFAPLHCLNFGIPEDRIENVLWRIENGELDNLNPKVRCFCISFMAVLNERWLKTTPVLSDCLP